MHAMFGFWQDGIETLAQCDTCKERHYFKNLYFAKQWANRHAYGIYYPDADSMGWAL